MDKINFDKVILIFGVNLVAGNEDLRLSALSNTIIKTPQEGNIFWRNAVHPPVESHTLGEYMARSIEAVVEAHGVATPY